MNTGYLYRREQANRQQCIQWTETDECRRTGNNTHNGPKQTSAGEPATMNSLPIQTRAGEPATMHTGDRNRRMQANRQQYTQWTYTDECRRTGNNTHSGPIQTTAGEPAIMHTVELNRWVPATMCHFNSRKRSYGRLYCITTNFM